MIEKLTPEQEAMIPKFVDDHIKIGLQSGNIDREKAKAYAKKLYTFLGKPEPTIIFADGPTQAWMSVVWLNDWQNKPAENKVAPTSISDIDFDAAKTMAKDVTFIWPYLDGQFLVPWVAWVRFMRYIGVQLDAETSILEDQVEFNLIYPLENFCVFSERFSAMHTKNNQLHKDGGPSVEYPDGTKCWSLNGVSVPQWLAETPWDKIDCNIFPTLQNAEVRREFIRKVGVERLCQKLGSEVIDKQGDYELHVIDLKGTTGRWPYLKMMNPSVGCWHMECVGKECKTVKEALVFRNESELEPTQLT